MIGMRISSAPRRTIACVALTLTASTLVFLPASPAASSYPGTAGRLFFSSDRGGGQDIYSMNADGTGWRD